MSILFHEPAGSGGGGPAATAAAMSSIDGANESTLPIDQQSSRDGCTGECKLYGYSWKRCLDMLVQKTVLDVDEENVRLVNGSGPEPADCATPSLVAQQQQHPENLFPLQCCCASCINSREMVMQLYAEDCQYNSLWDRLQLLMKQYYDLIPESENNALYNQYMDMMDKSSRKWFTDARFMAKNMNQVSLASNLPLSNEMAFVMLSNVLTSRDAHQLFELLCLQLRSIVQVYCIGFENLFTEKSEAGGGREYSAPDVIDYILTGYRKLCQSAHNVTPLLRMLEQHHLDKFGLSWQLINQRIFQRYFYYEVQKIVPDCMLKMRELPGRECNDIVTRFFKFDKEMYSISLEWAEVWPLLYNYHRGPEDNERRRRISKVHSLLKSIRETRYAPDAPQLHENPGRPIAEWLEVADRQLVWQYVVLCLKSKWIPGSSARLTTFMEVMKCSTCNLALNTHNILCKCQTCMIAGGLFTISVRKQVHEQCLMCVCMRSNETALEKDAPSLCTDSGESTPANGHQRKAPDSEQRLLLNGRASTAKLNGSDHGLFTEVELRKGEKQRTLIAQITEDEEIADDGGELYHIAWATFNHLPQRMKYKWATVQPARFCTFQKKRCNKVPCIVALNIVAMQYPLRISQVLLHSYKPVCDEQRISNAGAWNIQVCEFVQGVLVKKLQPLQCIDAHWERPDASPEMTPERASELAEYFMHEMEKLLPNVLEQYFTKFFIIKGNDISIDLATYDKERGGGVDKLRICNTQNAAAFLTPCISAVSASASHVSPESSSRSTSSNGRGSKPSVTICARPTDATLRQISPPKLQAMPTLSKASLNQGQSGRISFTIEDLKANQLPDSTSNSDQPNTPAKLSAFAMLAANKIPTQTKVGVTPVECGSGASPKKPPPLSSHRNAAPVTTSKSSTKTTSVGTQCSSGGHRAAPVASASKPGPTATAVGAAHSVASSQTSGGGCKLCPCGIPTHAPSAPHAGSAKMKAAAAAPHSKDDHKKSCHRGNSSMAASPAGGGDKVDGTCVCYYCTLFGQNECSHNQRVNETRERLRKIVNERKNQPGAPAAASINKAATKPPPSEGIPLGAGGRKKVPEKASTARKGRKAMSPSGTPSGVPNCEQSIEDLIRFIEGDDEGKETRGKVSGGKSSRPDTKHPVPQPSPASAFAPAPSMVAVSPAVMATLSPTMAAAVAEEKQKATKKLLKKNGRKMVSQLHELQELFYDCEKQEQMAHEHLQQPIGMSERERVEMQSALEAFRLRKHYLEAEIVTLVGTIRTIMPDFPFRLDAFKAPPTTSAPRGSCCPLQQAIPPVNPMPPPPHPSFPSQANVANYPNMLPRVLQPGHLPVQALHDLEDPSGATRQMVTIKRTLLPHAASQVTVTAKGDSPDQDQVLYTFVNGQLVRSSPEGDTRDTQMKAPATEELVGPPAQDQRGKKQMLETEPPVSPASRQMQQRQQQKHDSTKDLTPHEQRLLEKYVEQLHKQPLKPRLIEETSDAKSSKRSFRAKKNGDTNQRQPMSQTLSTDELIHTRMLRQSVELIQNLQADRKGNQEMLLLANKVKEKLLQMQLNPNGVSANNEASVVAAAIMATASAKMKESLIPPAAAPVPCETPGKGKKKKERTKDKLIDEIDEIVARLNLMDSDEEECKPSGKGKKPSSDAGKTSVVVLNRKQSKDSIISGGSGGGGGGVSGGAGAKQQTKQKPINQPQQTKQQQKQHQEQQQSTPNQSRESQAKKKENFFLAPNVPQPPPSSAKGKTPNKVESSTLSPAVAKQNDKEKENTKEKEPTKEQPPPQQITATGTQAPTVCEEKVGRKRTGTKTFIDPEFDNNAFRLLNMDESESDVDEQEEDVKEEQCPTEKPEERTEANQIPKEPTSEARSLSSAGLVPEKMRTTETATGGAKAPAEKKVAQKKSSKAHSESTGGGKQPKVVEAVVAKELVAAKPGTGNDVGTMRPKKLTPAQAMVEKISAMLDSPGLSNRQRKQMIRQLEQAQATIQSQLLQSSAKMAKAKTQAQAQQEKTAINAKTQGTKQQAAPAKEHKAKPHANVNAGGSAAATGSVGSVSADRAVASSNISSSNSSLMDQLSRGVGVEGLNLPPGITLTRVDPSHAEVLKFKRDSIRKICEPMKPVEQQPPPTAAAFGGGPMNPPGMFVVNPMSTVPLATSGSTVAPSQDSVIMVNTGKFKGKEQQNLLPGSVQDAGQTSKRRNKRRNRNKQKEKDPNGGIPGTGSSIAGGGSMSTSRRTDGSNIVTLRNPMFQGGGIGGAAGPTRPGVVPAGMMPPDVQGARATLGYDQPATIFKNDNGMFTIRNPALHHALSGGAPPEASGFRPFNAAYLVENGILPTANVHHPAMPLSSGAPLVTASVSAGVGSLNGGGVPPGYLQRFAAPPPPIDAGGMESGVPESRKCKSVIGSEMKNAQKQKHQQQLHQGVPPTPRGGWQHANGCVPHAVNNDLFSTPPPPIAPIGGVSQSIYSSYDRYNLGGGQELLSSSVLPAPGIGYAGGNMTVSGVSSGGTSAYYHPQIVNSVSAIGSDRGTHGHYLGGAEAAAAAAAAIRGNLGAHHCCDDDGPPGPFFQAGNLGELVPLNRYDDLSFLQSLQPGQRLNSEVTIHSISESKLLRQQAQSLTNDIEITRIPASSPLAAGRPVDRATVGSMSLQQMMQCGAQNTQQQQLQRAQQYSQDNIQQHHQQLHLPDLSPGSGSVGSGSGSGPRTTVSLNDFMDSHGPGSSADLLAPSLELDAKRFLREYQIGQLQQQMQDLQIQQQQQQQKHQRQPQLPGEYGENMYAPTQSKHVNLGELNSDEHGFDGLQTYNYFVVPKVDGTDSSSGSVSGNNGTCNTKPITSIGATIDSKDLEDGNPGGVSIGGEELHRPQQPPIGTPSSKRLQHNGTPVSAASGGAMMYPATADSPASSVSVPFDGISSSLSSQAHSFDDLYTGLLTASPPAPAATTANVNLTIHQLPTSSSTDPVPFGGAHVNGIPESVCTSLKKELNGGCSAMISNK